MSDLVKRLREMRGPNVWEAADRIDALEAENKALREALNPLAEKWLSPDDYGFEYAEDVRADEDWDEDANDMTADDVFILRRDIRRARALLAKDQK